MKKNSLIIYLLILYSSCCFAQQEYSIESITFKLPLGTVEIANTSLNPNIRKDKKVILFENIYQVDAVYLGISTSVDYDATGDNDLEIYKNHHDYLMEDLDHVEASQYKSSLETINNNKVLVFYFFYYNVGDYFFKVLKNDNSEVFNGSISFENESNYDVATSILNMFLESVQFQ